MAALQGGLNIRLTVDTTALSKGLMDANRQLSRFASDVQSQSSKINVSTGSIVQGFAAIAGINLGISGIREFGNEVLKMTGMMQGLALSFETMLGNKAAADQMMMDVKQFALDTPYTITETASIVKQLIAMNAAGDDVMQTYKTLGDVAAGLNVPISRIAINFGQVAALGKLQAREIRDFAMAGVPIYDALSKSMGKTVQEIQGMVSAGQVGFPETLAAFKQMSDEGGRFAGMMEKLNSTVSGQMNRLTDQVQQMYAKIGGENTGFIYSAISGVASLVENYKAIIDILQVLIVTYGSVKAAQMIQGGFERANQAIRYEAEVQGLEKLILAKNKNRNTDLQELVDNKKITASQAERIASLRALYVAEEQRNVNVATRQLATAQERLNTIATNQNTTAKQLNSAQARVNSAQNKLDAANLALNTANIKAATAATAANAKATGLMAVAGRGLTTVWKGLSAVLKSAGIGLALSAMIGVVTNIIGKIRELNAEQRRMASASKEFAQSIISENTILKMNFDTLNDLGEGTKEYSDKKKELFSRYSSYLSNMTEEQFMLSNTTTLYGELVTAIQKVVSARMQESAITEAATAKAETQQAALESIQKRINSRLGKGDAADAVFMRVRDLLEDETNRINEAAAELSKLGITTTIGADAYRDLFNFRKAEETFNSEIEEIKKTFKSGGKQVIQALNEGMEETPLSERSFDDIDFALKAAIEESNRLAKDKFATDNQKAAQQQLLDGLKAEYDARVKVGNVSLKYAKDQLANIEKELNAMDALERKGAKGIELRRRQQQAQDLVGLWSTADSKTSTEKVDIEKQEQKLTELLLELDNERRQSLIDQQKEGLPKTLAQIDEDYRLRKQEIRKQEAELREAAKSAGKTLTPEQTVMYGVNGILDMEAEVERRRARKEAIDEEIQDEQDKFKRLVELYGNYNQRRQQILEEGEKLISNTPAQFVEGVKQAIDNDLAALGDDFGMFSQGVEDLFERTSRKTVAELQAILDKGKLIREAFRNGDYAAYVQAEGGSANMLNEEQFKQNAKDLQFLENFDDKLRETGRQVERTTISFKALSETVKNIFNGNATFDDWEKFGAQLENISNVASAVGESVSSIFSAFGNDSAAEMAGDLTNVINGIGQTAQGVSKIMAGDIVGGIVDGVKGIASTITSIVSLSDRGNERAIKALQVRYDDLSKVIDDLDTKIEEIRNLQNDSYSRERQRLIDEESAAIEESNKKILEQNQLIAEQIQQERDKSNTDDDRIKDWQEQIDSNNKSIEENNKLLAENKERRIDAIYGSDVQSAISDFAQAYADAWANGVPSGQGIKDAVKNLMKQAVMEIIKGAPELSNALTALRDTILPSFLADSIISDDELSFIENWANSVGDSLDKKYSGLMGIFEDEANTPARTLTSQGLAQASQESIDFLTGVIVNIENSVYLIKEAILKERQDMADTLLRNMLTQITAIRTNTDRLEAVENYLRAGNSTLADVSDSLRQLNR